MRGEWLWRLSQNVRVTQATFSSAILLAHNYLGIEVRHASAVTTRATLKRGTVLGDTAWEGLGPTVVLQTFVGSA